MSPEPAPPAPARRRFSPRIRVQFLLIAVTAAAALVATWQFSQAGGAYQAAVREDLKRIDPATATALRLEREDLPGMEAEQIRQVGLAQRSGDRAMLLAAATALAVVAQALAATALVMDRRRWLLWPAGVTALSLALTAATAF